MHTLDLILKNLNHHAYFIHSFQDASKKLKDFLHRKFGIDSVKNPDFSHLQYKSIGIDESRSIKEMHSSKSFSQDSKRIFIIEAESITNEAQNALLKIFEEPHENTHFFLILPYSHILLPTLKSRLYIIDHTNKNEEITNNIKKFISLSKKEKIDYVDEIAKDISDEKLSKQDAINFINSLERYLYDDGLEKNKSVLNAIIKARDYISDKSSSIKQLLEYIVLNLN